MLAISFAQYSPVQTLGRHTIARPVTLPIRASEALLVEISAFDVFIGHNAMARSDDEPAEMGSGASR